MAERGKAWREGNAEKVREYQRRYREAGRRRGVVFKRLSVPHRLDRWAGRLRWNGLKDELRREMVRELRADHEAWLCDLQAEPELW